MSVSTLRRIVSGAMILAAVTSTAPAAEIEIGEAQTGAGLQVAAVYLQPVEMDPPGMMLPADQSDIHLEADIGALAGNANGFVEGTWVPHLRVDYVLSNEAGFRVSGPMMPMVASDGPHYGDNVKLAGPGRYRLTLVVSPPNDNHGGHFGRHTDRETGVAKWFDPVTFEYEFVFAGTGKKGGY